MSRRRVTLIALCEGESWERTSHCKRVQFSAFESYRGEHILHTQKHVGPNVNRMERKRISQTPLEKFEMRELVMTSYSWDTPHTCIRDDIPQKFYETFAPIRSALLFQVCVCSYTRKFQCVVEHEGK